MYIIDKVLNHNSLLVKKENDTNEYLLLGTGVGFGKKPNDTLTPNENVVVYCLQSETDKGVSDDIIAKVDPIYIEISSEIISLAKKAFAQIDDNILLPLSDHIHFAIERMKNNMNIVNPFANDIRLLYPEEYNIALQAKELIQEKTGYEIIEDEVGYITLHVHSARCEEKVNEAMLVAIVVNESIQRIEQTYGIQIDVESLSYSRLLTHMKYLLARIKNNEVLTLDMEEYVQGQFPKSYAMAKQIVKDIERTLQKRIPVIETGYLALHIQRICQLDEEVN